MKRVNYYQLVCTCEKPEPVMAQWECFTSDETGSIKVFKGNGSTVCQKCQGIVEPKISPPPEDKP